MEALTIEELKQMAGEPVWCPDEEAYGIVICDNKGRYAGIPFLYGVWYHDGIGTKFEYNIIGRKLKCFKIEDKKEFAMPLKTKVDAFGNRLMVCPNCESTAVVKPSRKVFELYPYCPWCGQKLKGDNINEEDISNNP